MTIRRCDICGKLLESSSIGEPSYNTRIYSVEWKYIYEGVSVECDLCPRCFKRMKRYLAREAKREDKINDDCLN